VCHPASATKNSRFVNKHRVDREYRITVKKHLGEGSVSMRVEKVLALLVESGFVYCCVWVCITVAESTYICGRDSRFTILMQILYPISAFGILPEPGPIVIQSLLLFVVVSQSTRATVPQILNLARSRRVLIRRSSLSLSASRRALSITTRPIRQGCGSPPHHHSAPIS
jgi:hypothetical protein